MRQVYAYVDTHSPWVIVLLACHFLQMYGYDVMIVKFYGFRHIFFVCPHPSLRWFLEFLFLAVIQSFQMARAQLYVL
jgi:hypothetical protein